ncbi:hypothetical protein, partial [Fibrobacter sp.]
MRSRLPPEYSPTHTIVRGTPITSRFRGYLEVITPEIVNKTLWIKSGHADKYNENMFKTLAGDVEMAVKPMNCPCHIQIF